MAITINDNVQLNSPKPLDNKYMKFSGSAVPYASAAEVNSIILSAYRHRYMTVLVLDSSELVEYWYRAGTADGDLESKNKQVSVLNANGSMVLKGGYYLQSIIVVPANNLTTFQIGLTPAGTEIETGADVTAGESYIVSYPFYSTFDQTIYFTNVASGTKIILRKSF